MDEQERRRRFGRWQPEALIGGETAQSGLFGKALGLLGLDESGARAATSWGDAAKHTAGNLINAPQDIGNQLLDLQDYQPVYGTGASNPEDRARAGQQAVSTFGLAGLAPLGGMAAGKAAGKPAMASEALYANSKEGAVPGLAMDHASRMQRAKDMGFDTDKTWYRGSNSDEHTTRPGTWIAEDPNYSNAFARGDGANVMPLHADTAQFAPSFMGLSPEEAMRAGFKGRLFGDGTAQVFDPSKVRSVNAVFDPAKRDSPDLLASNAREGAVPGLGMTGQSEQNDPYRTALQMQVRRKMLGLPH